MPVFGERTIDVSPRIGHLHIAVNDWPRHFVEVCDGTIILFGLINGSHKVQFYLADPTHKVMISQTVKFTVPNLGRGQRSQKLSCRGTLVSVCGVTVSAGR